MEGVWEGDDLGRGGIGSDYGIEMEVGMEGSMWVDEGDEKGSGIEEKLGDSFGEDR